MFFPFLDIFKEMEKPKLGRRLSLLAIVKSSHSEYHFFFLSLFLNLEYLTQIDFTLPPNEHEILMQNNNFPIRRKENTLVTLMRRAQSSGRFWSLWHRNKNIHLPIRCENAHNFFRFNHTLLPLRILNLSIETVTRWAKLGRLTWDLFTGTGLVR